MLAFLALTVMLSALGFRETAWGGRLADGLLLIFMGVFATGWFARMWAGRSTYLRHDRSRLYRGSEASWALASIDDVIVTRNWAGVRSVRIRLSAGSQPELAKAYMLIEDRKAFVPR